jgi:hypothetical protein
MNMEMMLETKFTSPSVRSGMWAHCRSETGAEGGWSLMSGGKVLLRINRYVRLSAADAFGTGTAWPDLIVTGIVAALDISGGAQRAGIKKYSLRRGCRMIRGN